MHNDGPIALWKHAELRDTNRRTAAMAAMQAVEFQGDEDQCVETASDGCIT